MTFAVVRQGADRADGEETDYASAIIRDRAGKIVGGGPLLSVFGDQGSVLVLAPDSVDLSKTEVFVHRRALISVHP